MEMFYNTKIKLGEMNKNFFNEKAKKLEKLNVERCEMYIKKENNKYFIKLIADNKVLSIKTDNLYTNILKIIDVMFDKISEKNKKEKSLKKIRYKKNLSQVKKERNSVPTNVMQKDVFVENKCNQILFTEEDFMRGKKVI